MQTERAKRMDSAGEEAFLNSPELPLNQLKRLRRACFVVVVVVVAVAAVIMTLAIILWKYMIFMGSVSHSNGFVQFQSSVICIEEQDCILSCSFNYRAGGWDEWSHVTWRRAETDHIVHRYYNNREQLNNQLPQYVNRTSLFNSELQRGNASLLLRRVREEDAGKYECSVYTSGGFGPGLIEVVVVPAEGLALVILGVWVIAVLCAIIILWFCFLKLTNNVIVTQLNNKM